MTNARWWLLVSSRATGGLLLLFIIASRQAPIWILSAREKRIGYEPRQIMKNQSSAPANGTDSVIES
eukprot:scaffold421264_cov48-Attheya_sp.AAC.2